MTDTKQVTSDFRQSKRTYWQRHIKEQDKSNLTQVEYCRQNHLNRYTFTYWKSKLNKETPFKALLPVSIEPDKISSSNTFPSGISLSFNNRFNVRLEVGFNCDTLLRLMDLLETR